MRHKRKIETAPFRIIVDTREQQPFHFVGLRGKSGKLLIPKIVTSTLETGDYSIEGMESIICVERKSMSDLFACCGRERGRFVRELERMQSYRFAAIVVESDYSTMVDAPPPKTKMNPYSVINSLLSWSVTYGVHVFAMPTRREAELATWQVLKTAYKHSQSSQSSESRSTE